MPSASTFALGCPTWGLLGDAQCSHEAVLGSAGAHRVPETLIGPPGTEQDTAASRHLPALNAGAFDSSCIIPSAPTWLQQQTQQKDFLFFGARDATLHYCCVPNLSCRSTSGTQKLIISQQQSSFSPMIFKKLAEGVCRE